MKLSQCIGAVVALSLCGQLNTASLDEQCLGLGLSHDLCLERAFAEDYASLGPDVSYNSDYYKFSYTLGYGARFPNAFMFKHPRYNAEMCDMVYISVNFEIACNSQLIAISFVGLRK